MKQTGFEKRLNKEGIFRVRFKNILFECNRSSITAFFSICFGGSWDPLFRNLRPDDVVLDAGANVGVFSLLASNVVKKVYSVEPNKRNYALLSRNIELNGIRNISSINIALGDSRKTGFLEGEGIVAHLSSKGEQTSIDTIDNVTMNDVTVIKMDIEGSEKIALKDQKALDRVRLLGVECDDSSESVEALLVDRGFVIGAPYAKLVSKTNVLNRVLSKDFFYDEIQSQFAMLRFVLRNSLLDRFNPLVPLQDSDTQRIIYAIKPQI